MRTHFLREELVIIHRGQPWYVNDRAIAGEADLQARFSYTQSPSIGWDEGHLGSDFGHSASAMFCFLRHRS